MDLADGAAAKPVSAREALSVLTYSVVLAALNLFVCHSLLAVSAAQLNSNQGQWIALARYGAGSWLHPAWWPYWNGGMPFEYAAAPLIPALAAALAALRGATSAIGVETVTALVYILAPLTLFLMAWRLTGAAGWSFLAALVYSFTSVTQVFLPDGTWNPALIWDHRRLFGMAVWDETAHVAALACLPLIILFLARSFQTRKPIYYAAAAFFIALASLASWSAPLIVLLAGIGLLVTLRPGSRGWRSNLLLLLGIGLWAWAIAAPFLSPSAILAIFRAISDTPGEGWTPSSLTAAAIFVLGGALVWEAAKRLTTDWTLRFFALLSWFYASVPITQALFQRHFLPFAGRFKFETEMTVCFLLVFALRPWCRRLSVPIRRALVLVALAFAADQAVEFQKVAANYSQAPDVTQSAEYRSVTWAHDHYPDLRFAMPGSLASWTNAFASLQQFTIPGLTIWPNGARQLAASDIVDVGSSVHEDAQRALLWLKAYGVGAAGIPPAAGLDAAPKILSPGKPDAVPSAPVAGGGVTFYGVGLREPGLAHIVPENALVRRPPRNSSDLSDVARYVAALDDSSLPATSCHWEGRNRIRIHTSAGAGQVLSVQESYHSGWHASIGGQPRPVEKDGLGMMWLRPQCSGACDIVLDYDGGWELRLCRWLSYAALAALFVLPAVGLRRRG